MFTFFCLESILISIQREHYCSFRVHLQNVIVEGQKCTSTVTLVLRDCNHPCDILRVCPHFWGDWPTMLLEIWLFLPCCVYLCFVLICNVLAAPVSVWSEYCVCLLLIWAKHSLKSRLHPSVISGSDTVSSRSSFNTRLLNIPALSSFA